MSYGTEAPRALLVLEDGRFFRGRRFGDQADSAGEVVFNTSMMGYQEILTDPSYAGQIVVMTYPMIGNYGINPHDLESRQAFLRGLIVKEPSRIPSNWRHDRGLPEYLRDEQVPGLWDIDTRALVRHLRERGSMRGVIADDVAPGASPAALEERVRELTERARAYRTMSGTDLASEVTTTEPYPWTAPSLGRERPVEHRFHVVAYDFGLKRNMARRLVDEGCRVTVVPASTSAEDVLAMAPDGVMLSNGPGDPEPVDYAVRTIQKLLGRVPLFGICLGHQLLALAAGGKTFKLKFGHRGANHPVMDLTTRKVEITSQNHGFAVDADSLPADLEITHVNLSDQTVEGLRLRNHPAFSVQYHPEAAPGPRDADYLFRRFAALMAECKQGGR